MAKIIVSCRFQKSAKDMADLIRYMATREGVEKLPSGQKYNIASSKQHDLILSVVKQFPESKKFLEYTHCTAAALRAKDSVMKTVTTVQENAEDIYAEAKQINLDRKENEKPVELELEPDENEV